MTILRCENPVFTWVRVRFCRMRTIASIPLALNKLCCAFAGNIARLLFVFRGLVRALPEKSPAGWSKVRRGCTAAQREVLLLQVRNCGLCAGMRTA